MSGPEVTELSSASPVADPHLARKVFRAGFWVMMLRGSQQGIALVRTVLIANVLAPGDFGVLGIALLSQTWIELATGTGFSTALIQRKGDIRSYLDVAWTVEIARAGVTGAILMLASGWIAGFFGAPEARPIVQVVGAVYALRGLQNIAMVHLRRELNFRLEFFFRFGQTVANTVVAVAVAFALRSVWALAFGLLAEVAAAVVLSYVIHPYRPRLRFELGKAWELFRYGRWVVLGDGAQMVALQADRFFVGKLLGPTALGLYQVGIRLSLLVASELAEGISRVGFPTYAALQDELPRLRRALERTLEVGMVIVLPTGAVIALLGPQLVPAVLGEQWVGAVGVVQVLALAGIPRFVTSTGVMPFHGIGQPSVSMRVTFVSLIAMVALLWPLITLFGLPGAAGAVLAGNAVAIPYLVRKWQTVLGVRIRDLARVPLPGLLLASLATLAIVGARFTFEAHDAWFLPVALTAAALAYVGGSALLWRQYRVGPFNFADAVWKARSR